MNTTIFIAMDKHFLISGIWYNPHPTLYFVCFIQMFLLKIYNVDYVWNKFCLWDMQINWKRCFIIKTNLWICLHILCRFCAYCVHKHIHNGNILTKIRDIFCQSRSKTNNANVLFLYGSVSMVYGVFSDGKINYVSHYLVQ